MISSTNSMVSLCLRSRMAMANQGTSIAPTAEDVAGFERYIENYKQCLPIEQAAVDAKK